MKSISVLNFSGVYERQSFYKDRDCEWIDCSDLSGVNGFCDETSREEIDARISGLEEMCIRDSTQCGAVVRFHVIDNHIVQRSSGQNGLDVYKRQQWKSCTWLHWLSRTDSRH